MSIYSEKELAILREAYGKRPANQVAIELSRTASAVYQAWGRLGLSQKRRDPKPLVAFVREKHALGWSDGDIANAWQEAISRSCVSDVRRKLGLPINRWSDHCRAKVAKKTREQCAAAGVKSLAEVRRLAYMQFAARHGWPVDLRPRAVQILDLLYQYGPKTRRQLADSAGMSWLGSRWSLKSNDPEGSYLAHLVKRGLVVRTLKAVKGRGKGGSCDLYSIAPHIRRGACQPSH
jgi:hypothetical protein